MRPEPVDMKRRFPEIRPWRTNAQLEVDCEASDEFDKDHSSDRLFRRAIWEFFEAHSIDLR